MSPASDAVYGVPPSALPDGTQHRTTLIVPDDRDTALAHLQQGKTGEVLPHEVRIRRPSDGAERCISNTSYPLRDAQGHGQRVGGIARDVTGAFRAAFADRPSALSRVRGLPSRYAAVPRRDKPVEVDGLAVAPFPG